MIHTLTITTPAQILANLKHVEIGGILTVELWETLFDMGLVDTVTESDGYMRDVLTVAGRDMLEGQGTE